MEDDQNVHRSGEILPLIKRAWDLGISQVDSDAYRDCMSQLSTYPEDVILSAILDATNDCTADKVLSLSYILDLCTDSSAVRAKILSRIRQTPQDTQNYCPLVFLAAQVEEKIHDDPEIAENLTNELLNGKREKYSVFINDLVKSAVVVSAISQNNGEKIDDAEHVQEQEWASEYASKILCLKVSLAGLRPPIWRVIEVPATYTFWDLHVAIQDVVQWDGMEPHVFIAGRYGSREKLTIGLMPANPTLAFFIDPFDFLENEEFIGKWFSPRHPPCQYIYDFRASWVFNIKFQKILKKNAAMTYPRCISGNRATPPSDCGGPKAYREWKRRQNRGKEEDKEIESDEGDLEEDLWDGFDPDDFTPRQVRFRDPREVWRIKEEEDDGMP